MCRRTVVSSMDSWSCVLTLARCLDNAVCYAALRRVKTDCVWNDTSQQDSLPCPSDIAGRRQACLTAIDSFLDAVDRQLTEELLYCRCDGVDGEGGSSSAVARACVATMGALRPACSVVELPPPNCADVLQRCLDDNNCRCVQFFCFSSTY